jgi:hypothetical protein
VYLFVLVVHSLVRWLVVGFGIAAVARGLAGWSGGRVWSPLDSRLGLLFMISLDVQVLLGLLLYFFLSPLTTMALADMGGAMRNPVLRFWAVEHLVVAILALALVHIGRARARRSADSRLKFRRSAIFFGLALLAVLAAIPWPFLAFGRPLFRFF